MKTVVLQVNGQAVAVPDGANVAAAIAQCGSWSRRSRLGAARAAFCGMGICFECRVRIDAVAHQRACMITARPGMRVETDD